MTTNIINTGEDPRLRAIAAAQPYPLLFATVSGAHLYGFPSPDSDFDLRGVHILPAEEVVGLEEGRGTIEVAELRPDLELDLVTHDIKKFFGLLLNRNGYVLEQHKQLARKVYVLADCMSAVTVPDGKGGFFADFTPQADQALKRFADAGMHVVRSTDPIATWPGIQLT